MITTVIRHISGKDLWYGDLPPIPKGHRINVDGWVGGMKVMDSAISVGGLYPTDSGYRVAQLVVVESAGD